MTEKQIVDQVKGRLVDLGYPLSSIKSNVRTGYGRSADLVVFEAERPWIVFELKASPHLVLPIKPEDIGFHSTVRQAQSLAQEIASRGITVNVIAPGFIQTDMTDALTDEQRDGIFNKIPLQRLGDPQDIANAVAFLASQMGSYITGETINVNGGMLMS